MTKEERTEVTAEAVKELQERKEMRTLSLQNVPIAAFNDLVGTQRRIEEEVMWIPSLTHMRS